MQINQDLALKRAILSLSKEEKDQLLLNLLSKDQLLLTQLGNELLENEADLCQKVNQIKEAIREMNSHVKQCLAYDHFYTPSRFMMDIRALSGLINEHALLTKHKVSEVDLRLFLLESVIAGETKVFFVCRTKNNEKLLRYFVGRIKSLLGIYFKLNKDAQLEFAKRLDVILKFAYQSAVRSDMTNFNLPKHI